jgi:hypothetical protein
LVETAEEYNKYEANIVDQAQRDNLFAQLQEEMSGLAVWTKDEAGTKWTVQAIGKLPAALSKPLCFIALEK